MESGVSRFFLSSPNLVIDDLAIDGLVIDDLLIDDLLIDDLVIDGVLGCRAGRRAAHATESFVKTG